MRQDPFAAGSLKEAKVDKMDRVTLRYVLSGRVVQCEE